MKNIIIADLKSFNNYGISTGHYFSLCRNYQQIFRDISRVIIAGGPIYSSGFQKEELLKLPYDWINGKNRFINVWHMLMNAKYLFRKTSKNDIIVIQMASAVTSFFTIFLFASKNHKIYTIQYDNESLANIIKRFIFKLASKKIAGIICPSELIATPYNRPYCIVSDYIYTGNNLKINVPFEEKKYDICMIGRIVPEKGVIEAARYLAGKKYKVIIAGKASSADLENELLRVASCCNNIELKLGFISDNDFKYYLQFSKYSLLNYHGVYTNRSSGIVLDTLFNGTPVIGHKCLALQFVEKNNVGLLFNNIDNLDLSFVNDKNKWISYIDSIKDYLKLHIEYKNKLVKFFNI